MSIRNARSTVTHVLALGTLALLLAACADTTAPSSPRVRAPAHASHQDGPPDVPCSSGWVMIDGEWVCEVP